MQQQQGRMWSIHLVVNKLLKAVEENFDESADNHFNFVDSYTIQQSSNNQNRTSVSSHFVEVPHINQQNTWDCGLACIIMVLQALGVHDCTIQELVELCPTTSIWTVDLAYLLQKFSVSFTYCTVTLGANPEFSVETYYKDQLPNDLRRVNMLFQEAREAGIVIECRSVGAKEISDYILSGKYIAIALVDQHILSRSQSELEDVCVSDYYSGGPGYTGTCIHIRAPVVGIDHRYLNRCRSPLDTPPSILGVSSTAVGRWMVVSSTVVSKVVSIY